MSEMSARARRRAFCLGSCTMNGFTGRSGPVDRFPGVLTPGAGGGEGGTGAGRGAACGGGGGGCTAGLGTVRDGAGAVGGAIGLAGRAGAKGGRASGGAVGMAGRLSGGGGADGGAIAARGGGGAGGAGAARGGAGAGGGATAAAAARAPSGLTAKTLLHTLQRARKPPAGTLAGSTRYTVSHDGHVTFTPRCLRFLRHRGPGRGADRPRRPTPPVSSRSSSFPSPAH